MRNTFAGTWAAAAFALALQNQSQAKSAMAVNLEAGKKQVVVACGTSLTANGAWVAQLDAALKAKHPGLATVVNSGGSGQWSQWGVDNLDRLVLQKNPDAVFIEFGINDSVARFKCPVEQSRRNLETLIDRILARNPKCEIVLMTTTPGDQYPEGHFSYRKDIAAYYGMYRDAAARRGLRLVDLYPEWLELERKDKALFLKYVPDTVHPTAEGCEKVVTPAVLRALGIEAEKPLHERPARPAPGWMTDGVIYQIQPRAFTPEGTLKAAQARLPRLPEDLTCGDERELAASVAKIKEGYDEFEKLSHLQLEFMEQHEQLEPDVFRTVFSDGEEIISNYRKQSFDYKGKTVQPMAYLLERGARR